MDSGDPLWTVLFVLVGIGIVIFFALMVKRNLSRGCSCCSGCSHSGKKSEGCCHCKEASRHSPLKK